VICQGSTKKRGASIGPQVSRCFFACNTLQAGFVRSNGFVIACEPGGDPTRPLLWHKPEGAFGLYDRDYVPLGLTKREGPPGQCRKVKGLRTEFDGRYEAVVFQPSPALAEISLSANEATAPLPQLAICSPFVLHHGIPRTPGEIQFCPNDVDQTIGNEVNWNPLTTCTSFTAFGVAENRIVVVSMFETLRGGDPARNRGITASEMGWLLKVLEAEDGVIGGGAADTQQFFDVDVCGLPTLLEAAPRFKRPEEGGAVEVQGARGLGAIFAAVQKQ